MPSGEGANGPVRVPSPEADELVASAIDGDVDAFAALFRATLPAVHRSVYARCGDAALAEDVSSEAYMRAMRSIGRFTGGSREFLAWMVRIARNTFLDHVKSAKVRWELVVDEMPVRTAASDPEAEAVSSVEADVLRSLLSELTDEQQEVVYLRFIEGLSVAEVADVVGRNEGAVKALQFRALRALARILDQRELFDDV